MTFSCGRARSPQRSASVAFLLFGCAQGAGVHADTASVTSAEHETERSAPREDTMRTSVATDESGARTAPSEAVDPAASNPPLLAVSGFGSAVVVLPRGRANAPLLVATHGAGGDPEWECERWDRVARGRWFLACPRGLPLRRGEEGSYYYPDHPALEREVTAVVDAARAKYGSLVGTTHGVYLGYSQGATMGALMVVEHGAEFPHLVLIEGGSGDWTLKRAERFRDTGGQSAFIVCGTAPCASRAATSARTLERAGLRAVARYAEGGGHTELGPVGAQAEALLETLAISGP